MSKFKLLSVFILLFMGIIMLAPSGVGAAEDFKVVPDWPGLYDPFTLLDYNIEMDPADWTRIVADTTYDIEVPAKFWAEDEPPILVSVRRKSATLLGSDKISLKVDINEYEDGGACDGNYGYPGVPCEKTWHGVKKLSLENGDDNNVVTEGLAWYMHSEAAKVMNYQSGMASWVTVTVNGDDKGVYVNVEQPDKQYLKNREMWDGNDTWLYKYSDVDDPVIKEYPEDLNPVEYHSPLYDELCFLPFQTRDACPTPGDFKDQLNANINMEGVLTFGAVTAFQGSPDDLFAKDKNFYFVDYTTVEKGLREYLEWDLDAAFSSQKTSTSIYNQGKKSDYYEKALVETPTAPFRGEYDAIMWRLLDGPLDETALRAAFTAIELEIGPDVAADPNNKLGDTVGGEFDNARAFVTARTANVISQLPDRPPAPPTVSITSPSDGAVVDGPVTVTADASDPDGSGVAQVEFFADGNSLGADTVGTDGWAAPAAWDSTAVPDGNYSVAVIATNKDGNTALDDIIVEVDNVDSLPEVSISSPVDGATVFGSVTITADAGDDKGVSQVEFFLNGSSLGIDWVGLDGWAAPTAWDTTQKLDDTVHTLSATATDSIGQTTSDTVSITVDNTDEIPVVDITSPLSGATVGGTVVVTANASDDNGVTQVEFFVDGSIIGVDSSAGGWSASWDTTAYVNGTYILTATATDTAGQTGSDSISVTVENIAPETMHIGSMTGEVITATKGKWSAVATVAVHDSAHAPLSGVVVSGVWSDGYTAFASCETDGSGQCSLYTPSLNKNKSSVTFTVNNLSGVLNYVPAENDGGNSITINN